MKPTGEKFVKSFLIWIFLTFPFSLLAQTLTMTSPSAATVTATLNSPMSFTCQVSAPPAGRIWGSGVIKHYSTSGGDISIGTFTIPAAFQTTGGSLTTTATFTHLPTTAAAASDTVRCLFKTGNGWNEPFSSTSKQVNLSGVVDTTPPAVPTGFTAPSGNITSSSIYLTWTASAASDISKYQIQKFNSANSLLSTTDVMAPTVNATMSSLTASTQYKFKIQACDTSNNCSGYTSTYLAATTLAAPSDTQAPTVPAGLLASSIQQTTATLSWTAATDNVGVTGYDVSINGGAAIAVAGTSYSATGLTASTTYNFKVRAKDAMGNLSAYSSTVNFTTSAASSSVTIPFYYGANAAVQLSATVQSAPASITLSWANVTNRSVSSIAIYRKLLTAASWGSSIATPSSSATSYTDTGVSLNTLYEYKVVINGSANGYIASGINANVDEYKGKILLIVDSTISPSITNDLKTLRRDLYGDGWIPLPVQTVARTASPASVRTIIQTAKTANADLKAVYLIGHVPAPYVGNNNPDGHAARVMGGDGYYAELDSTWSTSGCTNNPQQAVLNETPSASNMICNSNFPSTVELQSGRVDMYNLPSFSMNEVSLIQNYLSKAHSFKIKQISPIKRALIKDTFNANGWTNAAGVWGTLPSLVGINNVVVDNSSTTYTYNLLNNQSYLFNYGTGFGASCQGSNSALIGSTATAASTSWDGIFNMVFGSYFGEYNCQDSFLRGVLGSGDALANVYNSYNWYFHRMAMGQTIGDGALQTMNNAINGTYIPLGNTVVGTAGNTHESLMGDPSLRMEYISPPTNLVTTSSQLSWTASTESSIAGYHVYEVLGSNITRLTTLPVTGTSYSVTTAGRSFIVRAVKLVNGASGSYYLPSVGVITPALVP